MQQQQSIQKCYGDVYSHCYGCGQSHPYGLHLESFIEPNGDTILETTPDAIYTGGVPANLYGGFIAMLFDCHGTASAAAFYLNNKQIELSPETIERFVTAHLAIDYLKPTPMGTLLKVTAHPEEVSERKVRLSMQLIANDVVCARAEMIAVRIAK